MYHYKKYNPSLYGGLGGWTKRSYRRRNHKRFYKGKRIGGVYCSKAPGEYCNNKLRATYKRYLWRYPY